MTDASGESPGGEGSSEAPLTRREAAEARRAAQSVPEPEPAAPGPEPQAPGPEPQAPDRGPQAPESGSEAPDPGAAFQSHIRAAREEFESHVAQARADFEEANERIKERTGRDLILAILIGLGIGVVVVGSLVFVKQFFVVLALAAVLLGIFEFSRALKTSGRRVDVAPQLVAAVALIASAYFLDLSLHWIAVIVAVIFVAVWRMVAQMAARDGRLYGDVLSDVLVACFIQLYVAFLGSLCVVLVRQDGGEWWVLAFVIVAVAADTGAYAVGISFGRHPMAPRISPKKSWEGFGGAVAAAILAGVLVALFMLGVPWWTGVLFGLVILGTATLGDLGESMIKRDLGIKDMSSWLPGHGGVLDRLDSILPSTTAALALYYILHPLAA